MEVSTVSPPPASPTQGDDLCDTDVTNVAIHRVTLLISLCGLAGNGAVLRLISLEDIALFIFSLAVTDFLFLLFAVPSAALFLVEDVSCSPIMPVVYVDFLFQLSRVSYYWGLFCLIFASLYFYQECCCWDLPERLQWMVLFATLWAFFTLFTVIPTVTSLCPAHEQEQCQVALISINSIFLLLFAAPVVISSTILFIQAKCGSQQQEIDRDFIVLALIVLFPLLLSLWNFLQQLGYIVVSPQVDFLLTCINSSIKPLIYFLVGSSWMHCSVGRCWRHCTVGCLRASLRRVFEEPQEESSTRNDATRDTGV